MSPAEKPPDEAIEALVRKSLERSAERIDPRPVFERLQAAWPAPAGRGDGEEAGLRKVNPRRPLPGGVLGLGAFRRRGGAADDDGLAVPARPGAG